MSEYIDIGWEHDGIPLTGYLARPVRDAMANGTDGPTPALLCFPGAAGGERRMQWTVDGLAERGYIAAAVGMYDARIDTRDEATAGQQYLALHNAPDLLRARARGWFDMFAGLPGVDPGRIGTVGYCFGGMCALEIARSGANVQVTVAHHGLLTTNTRATAGTIRGPVQAWCAGRDPYVPVSDVIAFGSEMEEAGVRHQITTFSNAQHAFSDPDADSYGRDGIAFDPLAEAVSWAGTLALLNHCLRTPQ